MPCMLATGLLLPVMAIKTAHMHQEIHDKSSAVLVGSL